MVSVDKQAAPAAGRGLLSSWAQRHLNLCFVAGFLLVLLTYLVVSQQFAATSPVAVPTTTPHRKHQAIKSPGAGAGEAGSTQGGRGGAGKTEARPAHEQQQQAGPPKADGRARGVGLKRDDDGAAKPFDNGKVVCIASPFSYTCDVFGDVRTNGTAHTVTLVPVTSRPERREWSIQAYARFNMTGIPNVTVTQLDSTSAASPAPACTVTHRVPAIVLALGGHLGNYFHDFSDALVPLFVASRRYDGEVQLLASNIQPWWLGKYEAVVRRLTKYEVLDLDHDDQIRCFRHVTVGLNMHKEFNIVPELVPGGVPLSMLNFTAFLRETYSLPRAAPISLTNKKSSPPVDRKKKKPRLMLLDRGHYRKLVNVPEIVKAAEKAGFEVTIADPRFNVRVKELALSVNSFDVLLGVHGAGLTNSAFLPPGAVVIQVVPYGKLEPMAQREFGDPAANMGLRYLEYSISVEESTLLETLGPHHPAIKDPDSVHRSGWDKVAEYYLGKQNVRVDVERFAPTLALALDHLRRQ
ncbi:beta-1,2-xylosyltransferase XYXT1 isoform X1 [Aegilops tauschii subsp. strangulata]|uniref:Glycosyltransferase 61 catalytic domain-containing protein n=3 Tax=Aegilops tauschii subsp. strangulata TaxID=200361 RepID=A0A452XH98_AEGTS|nr:beta-1,2-xylosyltransferase XYXT1 isoform X1 [Aegilops tauschii subsp. strangulata]